MLRPPALQLLAQLGKDHIVCRTRHYWLCDTPEVMCLTRVTACGWLIPSKHLIIVVCVAVAHFRVILGSPDVMLDPQILLPKLINQALLIRLFSARSTDSLATSGRCRMSDSFWLTDAQMERLKPFFPVSHGVPRVDDKRVLSGIIFVNRNGLRWRDAPAVYGPHKTL